MAESTELNSHGVPLEFGEPIEGSGLEPLPPEFSDDALGDEFSTVYKDELRFVPAWTQWMAYTGSKWQREADTAVFQRARMICRAATQRATSDAMKIRLASAHTAASVEREARGDHRHAATAEQWDCDAMLLNTPSGVVDLRTGQTRGHSRADYMSKITMTGAGGKCPLWSKYLHRVTDGDEALQSFLQRTAGYCLTGRTDEQALFFLWGTGKNGKSVFLNTFSRVLGDYARTAPTSAFTANNSETHPTDLAGLHGARMVTAIETEDGKQWAEAKIKALTGGDPVTCRFMRQDFWTYTPIFKILIASNHKPTIRSVDEAIRRRIHLIPFTVWIPEEERDKELENKLRAEYGGILQWAIDGCLEWQRVGLNPPERVREATAEYLAAEDIIGRWIDERCVCGKQYSAGSSALFKSYKEWCEASGERPRSQRKLSQTLIERGFTPEHTRVGKMFSSIGIKTGMEESCVQE